MDKILKINNQPQDLSELSIRLLKKELKLIPADINKEKRFLDLLIAENHIVRTQVEKDVIVEFMQNTKKMVSFHENRLGRYQQCYEQIKDKKSFDRGLLFPEELQFLQKKPTTKGQKKSDPNNNKLLTGTDG